MAQKKNGTSGDPSIVLPPKVTHLGVETATDQARAEVLRTSKILLEAEEREKEAGVVLTECRQATKWAAINHRLAVADLRGLERLR